MKKKHNSKETSNVKKQTQKTPFKYLSIFVQGYKHLLMPPREIPLHNRCELMWFEKNLKSWFILVLSILIEHGFAVHIKTNRL